MDEPIWRDYRCPRCGRLLARVTDGLRGTVQIKCRNQDCHATSEFRCDRVELITDPQPRPHRAP